MVQIPNPVDEAQQMPDKFMLTSDDGSVEARASRLRSLAAEALIAILDSHDFNQSTVAEALGTSRTTLIKLMDDLGVARATDLTLDQINHARAESGDDLEIAARRLRVSPGALKRRLAILGLKPKS